MTTFLAILAAATILITWGISAARNTNRIIDEMHAAELRQIARERAVGLNANKAARWQG